MKGPIGSRDRAVVDMIRQLLLMRDPDPEYMEDYLPKYKERLNAIHGGKVMKLNEFINLMTALKCEVMVVPMGRGMPAWYRLNDFPDAEGNVLLIPDKVMANRYLKNRESVYKKKKKKHE